MSFDVVLHVGTLLAIFVYFWKDVLELIKAFFGFIAGKKKLSDPYVKLTGFIFIGTLPAVFAGFLLGDFIENTFREIFFVSIFMIIVGFVFILGEFVYKKYKNHLKDMAGWWRALIIGFAQAIALIPGVSRSGTTIVAGIFTGVERGAAARFSFLLGIPAMCGAALLTAVKIPEGGEIVATKPMLAGFLAAFLFGLLSVWGLMKLLKKHSLLIFAFYLLVLGFFLLF